MFLLEEEIIVCEDSYPEILNNIASLLLIKNIELILVNSKQMQDINKEQRGIDKTTDVLSFPYINQNLPNELIGSIVINIDLAKEKAKFYNHNFEDEIALLFIHGILHILGFDHEIDNGEMRQKEEKLIKDFNLPKSLIIRTQDE